MRLPFAHPRPRRGSHSPSRLCGRIAVGLILLSGCTGRAPDGAGDTSALPPGRLILFAADLDGNWDFYEGNADVFVMDEHGGNRRNLTNHPANDFSPEWSPDGSRIVFRTNRDGNHEIYVMNADGSDPVNLTRTDAEERSPAWSPDGTRIAFSSDRHRDRDIYVMNADGSNVVRLSVPGDDEYPTWSPDGTHIAFTSYCLACSSAGLSVIRVDGTGLRELHPSAGWPDWSPDGGLIAFDTRGPDGEIGVYVLDPRDGEEPSRLVRGLQGDWSGSGREIVYVVETGLLIPGQELRADIYVADADGSNVRQITDTPDIFEFEPTWQP